MCGHTSDSHDSVTGECTVCVCPTGWYIAAHQPTEEEAAADLARKHAEARQFAWDEFEARNRALPPDEQRD